MLSKTFSPLPIGSVKPKGILQEYLKIQMEGLTGHISEAGYPFESPKWGEEFLSTTDSPKWWVYEQNGYWLDGFIRTAILIDDEAAIEKAKGIIYAVLEKPDTDGFLGPLFMKKILPDGCNQWAHVVFFRACMALYEYTKDRKIVDAIKRHYLEAGIDFSVQRDVYNVEIMLWAYSETGDKALLDLAEYWYKKYNEKSEEDWSDKVLLSDKKPHTHGVSYNEYAKLGAILYRFTGNEYYLSVSKAAYKKAIDFFMLPSGCISSSEFTKSNDYMEPYETCDVTDFTWWMGYMFSVTGDIDYMDRIEKCVFNAGVGSVLEDFKGLQYFSSVNQVIADKFSNRNESIHCGDKWMSYRPNPGVACCPGNCNRFMPNYVYRQYFTDSEGVIYSTLFGEGTLNYNGIEIEQKTNFPFTSNVKYNIATDHPFTFKIRVPAWSKGVTLKVNGENRDAVAENSFITLNIEKETEIELEFAQEIEKHFKDNGIWFSRGPLTYALGIKTRREIDTEEVRSSKDFPAYNIYAESDWNYGIDPDTEVKFVEGTAAQWSLCEDLPKIELTGIKVKNWDYDKRDTVVHVLWEGHTDELPPKILTGNFVFTSRYPENPETDGESDKITLYPFGLCKLRVTVFPEIKN